MFGTTSYRLFVMKLPCETQYFKLNMADNPIGRGLFGAIQVDEKGVNATRMRQWGVYRLVLVLRGHGLYRDSQRKETPLHPGDFILVTPNQPHHIEPDPGTAWSYLSLAFNGSLFDSLQQTGMLNCGPGAIALKPVNNWYRRFYALLVLKELERQQPMRYLNRFLSVLNDIPFERQIAAIDQRPAWLVSALAQIEAADQATPLDVGQIARRSKIGESSFRRYFPRFMGCGPSEYHKTLRIKTACEAMIYGSDSSKQIAKRLGFCDEYYFSKYFKEKTGLAPSQFKKEIPKRSPHLLDGPSLQKMALQEWLKAEDEKRLLEERTAAERRRNWRLILQEDFAEKDLLSRWCITGEWKATHGELQVWSHAGLWVMLRTPIAGDVRMDFDCRLESEALSDVSCFLGSTDFSNQPGEPVPDGYFFQYGAWANQRNLLSRSREPLWSQRHSPLIHGRQYHMSAQKIGNRLILRADQATIFDVRDPSPIYGAEHAFLGLYSHGTRAVYSNIKIYTRDAAAQSDLLETAEDYLIRGSYAAAEELFQDVIRSSADPQRTEQAQRGLAKISRLQNLMAAFPAIQTRLLNTWPGARITLDTHGLRVNINRMGISDLSPLHGLPLSELSCDNNLIRDLQPLRNSRELTLLSCAHNQITHLDPLQDLPLTFLECTDNQITNLAPLHGMPLKELQCANNQISSLEPLRGMKLHRLGCVRNQIADLEPLRDMDLTKGLSFSNNRVSSLAPIRGMMLLRLQCAWNLIQDLEPLRGMDLQVLRCSGNQIRSLEPLQGMPLRSLYCSRNQIQDLTPVAHNQLRFISCHDNPIQSVQPLLKYLPKCAYLELDHVTEQEHQALEACAKTPGVAQLLRNNEILHLFKHGHLDKLKALAQRFGRNRYLPIPLESTWPEAKKISEQLGGHLAVIRNQKENEHLQSMVGDGARFWLGLTAPNGAVNWVTGESLRFTNFADEPHLTSNHVAITSTGTWISMHPWEFIGFFVQWP